MNLFIAGGQGYLGRNLKREQMKHPEFKSERPAFIHAACPRNKPGKWDWRLAEQSLDKGMAMAEAYNIPAEASYYISSLSVYDTPDNEYARFKRMAERVVQEAGWNILRLPTLLGGNPVRMDLGLHQIARLCALRSHNGIAEPYVNPEVVRHVMFINHVCAEILYHLYERHHGVIEITRGFVPFTEIVPRDVKRRTDDGPTYTCTVGRPMSPDYKATLRLELGVITGELLENYERPVRKAVEVC